MNRRGLLKSAALVWLPLSAGCGAYDTPRFRRLGFEELSVEEESGQFRIAVDIEVETNTGSEWGQFNQVVVVVSSRDGVRITSKPVGDLDPGRYPVGMTIEDFPHRLDLFAKESPCERDTEIEYAIAIEDNLWDVKDRPCER